MVNTVKGAQKEARTAARKQQSLIAEQRQKEQLALAEAESQVAETSGATVKPRGRSLLIATSPTGLKQTLGG